MSGDSELRTILHDQVNRLLGDQIGKAELETAETGASQQTLWQTIEENGLPRVLVPEDIGGVGGGWGEAEVVIRAAGKFQAPVPLVESILAGWLLSQAGLEMPGGMLSIGPVRRNEEVSIEREGGLFRVTGELSRVPWGRVVEHLVVHGQCDGEPYVALVPAAAWQVRAEDRNIAAEPRDNLALDGVAVAAAPLSPHMQASIDPECLFAFGAMARAGQIAGALESILEQTVQYANDRTQFGKPIGKFQAIQQELARMAGEVAAAGAAVEAASQAADRASERGGGAGFEMAVAKIRASEAASIVAGITHQTHGAIGFTYEHRLHFATRRLWSWRAEFGSETYWAEALGRELAGRGARALWPDMVDRN
ncbi:MAG: acyl-CoA dehydrogenase [Alphaproteobacteria bacterium]|jgi:acyl-CoA dehydrogenase